MDVILFLRFRKIINFLSFQLEYNIIQMFYACSTSSCDYC